MMRIGLWIGGLVIILAGIWLLCTRFRRKLSTVADHTYIDEVFMSILKHCTLPLLGLLLLLALHLLQPLLPWPEVIQENLTHIYALAIIALTSWLVIKITYVFSDYVVQRFDVTASDNLNARKVHTQMAVIRRIVVIIVLILAFGTALMTFEGVRSLGKTILASAGIIGIIVGMAAQKTIATFIAGLQIALTQPIRLDDVVIVENEWGRIEEITLTYVVVRIWDQRRLIVPVTYFMERPFQNWTRTSAELLGTVFLYTDYTIDLDSLRAELQRILNASPHWDKRVCVIQVTNATEKTMEIRALMSSADASKGWELRCEVREKLLSFIQKEFPSALPHVRAELKQKTI
jgi:small-conductance mechanosensitive channel